MVYSSLKKLNSGKDDKMQVVKSELIVLEFWRSRDEAKRHIYTYLDVFRALEFSAIAVR